MATFSEKLKALKVLVSEELIDYNGFNENLAALYADVSLQPPKLYTESEFEDYKRKIKLGSADVGVSSFQKSEADSRGSSRPKKRSRLTIKWWDYVDNTGTTVSFKSDKTANQFRNFQILTGEWPRYENTGGSSNTLGTSLVVCF